jgi:hypothetical protein
LITAFNLLNYPVQARRQRLRWRWGSGVAGWVMGLVVGALALQGLNQALEALSAEHVALQALSAQKLAQLGKDKVRKEALAMSQGQQALLLQVQLQQQAWIRLYRAVSQEARRSGWALERLQVDGDRLELHGRIRDAQALGSAQLRLSEQLQSHLTLLSLVANPVEWGDRPVRDGGHVFVWQGPWPSVPVVVKTAPGRAP